MKLFEEFKLYETLWDEASAENLTESTDWDAKLATADNLLSELVASTGNADHDDGDGYWEEEYSTWCYRYLYYGNLPNAIDLEKACEEYSNKLPNVEFYYVDDEECSEIGYTAER